MGGVDSIKGDRLEALAATFSGVLLQPRSDGYEEARRIHNGLIDKRPALIARCRGTADIVDALGFARESGLEISVRGRYGHSDSRECPSSRRGRSSRRLR